MINVYKVTVFDKVSYNNRKDRQYIVGFQLDMKLILPWFIAVKHCVKIRQELSLYNVIQCFGGTGVWCFTIETSTMKLNPSYEKSCQQRLLMGKMNIWKISWKRGTKNIKTNFDVQDVPYDIYYNVKWMLEVESVYKQRKGTIPRYKLQSINTLRQKTTNVTC